MNQCLLVQVLFTDGRTDKKTDRQRDRQTDKHGTDNNDTCSNQWYLPVGPTGPCEPGKPRGPGVIQSLLGSQWSQHDTEPAGTAVPGSTRGPETPGGPGKPGMPVAPVAPASPCSPGKPFGPENRFILSVFHFCNSKILSEAQTANINVKKLQFIHKLTASDTSKTAKITKKWYYSAAHWHLGDVLTGNHLFVNFAVLDVSVAVNLCINCSFFYIYYCL